MRSVEEDAMTVNEALPIARSLTFGPLPKAEDPMPSMEEAIALIHEERRTCGFNWLTGEAAEQVLREASDDMHRLQEEGMQRDS